ncbi:ABC transporter substrate-binding protein [Amnibacterium kyonggiense]|uniref:Amino acid ABC transporter substrate-binding protein (PAAT family) n=1 Tax=Amnibacterium kyonggiense TaxID=595671 RepID=A0A4R7FRU7_9MICO|nr:ABC transporter substrate-binding protein [Amnibacterium kyonggiense]TDS80540.1 amino acid ABC transporter substrate-binding protein (PAAT family) [Amnibacterium kyonggiense]
MIRRRSLLVTTGLAAVALALSACSGTSSTPAASSSGGSAAASGPAALQTVVPGKLTVATGQPAYSPWVEDNDPTSGKGFESAVTYAVAKQLGYAKSDVVWARSSFDSAITPGAKTWDLNIQQFSITKDREKVVDFSSPYYTTTQAVVTTKGSKAAGVTTLAGLKGLKIGVATGTTSYTVVNAQVGQPAVFSTVDDAVQALKTKQVDAVVTDLPGAYYIAGAQLKDGVVSAQFADSSDGGDQFAYVLPKRSPLTKPVSAAIDALAKSGELKQLTDEWLSSAVKVPVLQ